MGQGNKGNDSSVSLNSTTIFLARGGGADHHDPSSGNSNKDGGSGGGSGQSTYGVAVTTNTPSGAYGNSGGILTSYVGGGGGGGGASTSGSNSTSTNGGNGGNGSELSINGTATYYGGGGGGGSQNTATAAGDGGLGGGGAGSKGAVTATNGTDGRGGGGGGGGFNGGDNGNGGRGGAGIVIIRYRKSNNITSSTIDLIRGTSGDTNIDYSISNNNGDFKIISSISGTPTTRMTINQTSTSVDRLNSTGLISGGGNLLITGRVGIGTTNATNSLQVGGGNKLRISNDSSDYTMVGTNEVSGLVNTRITIFGYSYPSLSGNIHYITTGTTGSHIFYRNGGLETMKSWGTGAVSIQTTGFVLLRIVIIWRVAV